MTDTTLRFAAPLYPRGRHCLLCGTVTVGAVFPPPATGGHWEWQQWISGKASMPSGRAKSEHAAKNALMAQFMDFLRAAGLEAAR